MEQVVKISKIGKDVRSTNPNDFVFHSSYNTFKIIKEGTMSVFHNGSPITQVFEKLHGLDFTPFVSAFIKVSGESQAYAPNSVGVSVMTGKALVTNGVIFNYTETDATKVYFSITTPLFSEKTIEISYFLLEKII